MAKQQRSRSASHKQAAHRPTQRPPTARPAGQPVAKSSTAPAATAPRAAEGRSSRERSRNVDAPAKSVDFATEYHYVLGDLKRVGILAASMFATLIVLALIIH